jgi:hypothetical protein
MTIEEATSVPGEIAQWGDRRSIDEIWQASVAKVRVGT